MQESRENELCRDFRRGTLATKVGAFTVKAFAR